MEVENIKEYKKKLLETFAELELCKDYFAVRELLIDIREKINFCKYEAKYPEITASSILEFLKIENKFSLNENTSSLSENIKPHIVELMRELAKEKDLYPVEYLITQYSNMKDIGEEKRILYLETLFDSMKDRKGLIIDSAMYQWRGQFDSRVAEKEIPNSSIVLTAYYGSLKTDEEREGLLYKDLPAHGLAASCRIEEGWLVKLEVSSIEERISDIIQE